ncbi:MAG: M56 family metallopeptidase [Acetatifactor sp.]
MLNTAVTIINMSITAGIVILVVLVARLLLRRAPKVFSYALWGVVLFRLLCPLSFSSSFSVLSFFQASVNSTGEIQYFANQPEDATPLEEQPVELLPPVTYPQTAQEQLPLYAQDWIKGELSEEFPVNKIEQMPVLQEAQEMTGSAGSLLPVAEVKQESSQAKGFRDMAANVFSIVWLSGIAVLLGINVFSFMRIRSRVTVSMRLRDNIYLSDGIVTPFCLGIVNPRIYLPSSLGESEREYIILHEQHHIKRCDHIIKLLAFAALCLHWFNPLVWLAFTLAGKDMEMSCDEAVMRKMNGDIRAEYSASLLQLATGKKAFSAVPLSFGEGNPKQRIKNIMSYKKPGFRVMILAMIGCGVVMLCACTNPKAGKTEENTGDTEDFAVDGSMGKEDAVKEDGTAQPDFIPMGAAWEELGDIDGNGESEFVIYSGEDGNYQHFDFIFNGEKIYEHDDLCVVELGNPLAYVDLDHDGEKEILLTIRPHVNSMPLTEYAVLKKKDGEWTKLEMYAGEDILDNTFPISVTKGKDGLEAIISCAGLDKQISFDMERVCDYWRPLAEEGNDSLARSIIDYYDCEVLELSAGEKCGYACAWGVWDIQLSSYEGKPCLIAEQGIQGYDKFDFWGNLFLYFDYDKEGKIRILDMDFIPYEPGTETQGFNGTETDSSNQISAFAENWDELHNPFYEEASYEKFALVDLNHDGTLELLVSEVIGTYTYTNIFQTTSSGGVKKLTKDIKVGSSEPDLIHEWLTKYTDPASGREYYMTLDTEKVTVTEYYHTNAAIYLADDGETLSSKLIAREHVTYQPEKHEYFNSDQKTISREQYEKLVTDYFTEKGYPCSKVHFTWIGREQTKEASVEEIKKMLSTSYNGFREVDGNVDFTSFSASVRFDPDSRNVYFSCQGTETREGFSLIPYWEYLLSTQEDLTDRDSLFHQYYELFTGNSEPGHYPGILMEASEWNAHLAGTPTEFVAVKEVFGYEEWLDYWGELEIYFDVDDNHKKQIKEIYFCPSVDMQRLNGNYAGAEYLDSYEEIIKAYRIFAEEMKNESDLRQAYLAVGYAYVCEEYGTVGNPDMTPVYLIEDINEDGIPELFLGAGDADGNTYIYDAYTWKDGTSYQLLRGIGYRNGTCILCEDGLIKNLYSGSASDWDLLFQRLPQNGTSLETVESIQSRRRGDSDSVEIKYQGGIVSEEEVQKIVDSHKEKQVTFEKNE